MTSTEPIRVLIVDDHPVVRAGLASVLGTQPDLQVVGEAGDGAEAVAMAARLAVDVVLMDLEMPELDGVEAIKALRATRSPAGIVVFTAFDTDERILSAVEAGAQGYLLKGAPREELFNAVRVVAGGGALLQPQVTAKLLRRVRANPEPLTPREREVLALVARGLPNRAIAETLGIRERTVKFHVSALLGKLGAQNRTQAVALATERGLLPH